MVRWSDTDPDEALIRASLRDAEAFGVFYRRYVRPIHAFLASRLGDDALAADVTAEVFAKAVASRSRFDPRRGSAETWIWQIARSRLTDQLRHVQVVDRHRGAVGAMADVTVDEYDLGTGSTPALDALGDLPPAQREAVIKHVLDGEQHSTIARERGEDPAAVRKRVSRGLDRLRRALGEPGTSTSTDPEGPHV
ncbi:RNA polymerase sigma factor [Patulibacter sp. SYSU D01012]|uniref:RNA polymerase sigma factor n=1 Tax=Patulibacter sp. SYSU D01012 TaxID=2817381 RepID=UPI001B3115FA|nr:RNA polymerase sigma factor [Patulibacter sp. SYSU D01012]